MSVPVLLGDIADVREGAAVRRGMAHRLNGEVVSARIIKQFGSDTVTVAAGIRQRGRGHPSHAAARASSCASSTTSPQLVSSALGGVGRAVMLGGVFVVLVMFVLLGNVRAALARHADDSRSPLRSPGMLLEPLGVGLNTMTLGGLAIAVGLLVDAAIIMVENILHRLTRRVDRARAPRARARRPRSRSRGRSRSPRSS